jgi:hypothetical protein
MTIVVVPLKTCRVSCFFDLRGVGHAIEVSAGRGRHRPQCGRPSRIATAGCQPCAARLFFKLAEFRELLVQSGREPKTLAIGAYYEPAGKLDQDRRARP